MGAAGCGGEGQKSRRKREGGKARGMWERWGVGEGRKSRRKREGGRVRGIGEWWVRGKGKIAKKWGKGRGGRRWQGRIIPKKMANTNP